MKDENWDEYPCQVDDAPASVRVNLRWERDPRPDACDTLHVAAFEMADVDELGLGTDREAEHLGQVEDALAGRLTPSGFAHVGRLGNRGHWQISFYGPGRHTGQFLRHASDVAQGASRSSWTHVAEDVEWSYYTSFLLPDSERRQWMNDRAVVDQLAVHGDVHAKRRPVDHELVFPSAEAAELFLETARMCGFFRTTLGVLADRHGRFALEVQRDDRVELEHIHATVMELVELAAPYDGDHLRWRTSVVTD